MHFTVDIRGKLCYNNIKKIFKKELTFMTDKEMLAIKYMAYYQLRLIISEGEKKEYTKEEILELIDKVTMAKDQEN